MPTFDEIQAHIKEELGPEPNGTTGGTDGTDGTGGTGGTDGNGDGGSTASNNQNAKIQSSFSSGIGFGGLAKAARGTLDFAA
jgi:hypothetical protein